MKAIRLVSRFQGGPKWVASEVVLRTYRTMYDAYVAERQRIPPGRLVEISYEDLERDPVGQVRQIYDGLALGDFEAVRPALETYLGSGSGYRQNRHLPLDDATKRQVAEAWGQNFDVWGYPR